MASHEIGHNLGGEHSDGTSTMSNVTTLQLTDTSGRISTTTKYPGVTKKFGATIIKRHDSPKVNRTDGRLWKRK